jgi:hypothetical protein
MVTSMPIHVDGYVYEKLQKVPVRVRDRGLPSRTIRFSGWSHTLYMTLPGILRFWYAF